MSLVEPPEAHLVEFENLDQCIRVFCCCGYSCITAKSSDPAILETFAVALEKRHYTLNT